MDIDDVKEKTLILTQTNPDNDMMFDAWKKNGLNADIIFRPQKKWIRLIRRLWADGILPGCSIWYGSWKNKIIYYDTVIIHADKRTRTVPRYIHKIKPTMRIIYWYWNPVNKNTYPELTRDNNIECWSFDTEDCLKYSMKKNVQYYYEQVPRNDNRDKEYDVYFIGHEKGRKNKIYEIVDQLCNRNITAKIDIINDFQEGIPYAEVQRRIKRASVILEVVQEGQVGCTLRALEALFFEKKLITTNCSIVKEDFYNKKNIFIYGVDNLDKLNEFIKTPYDDVSNQFKETHTVEAWFANFFTRRK